MKKMFFNDRIRLLASRTKQDPEKSVLPAILWINTNHESFDELGRKGFMLVFGWWDYSFKIGIFL